MPNDTSDRIASAREVADALARRTRRSDAAVRSSFVSRPASPRGQHKRADSEESPADGHPEGPTAARLLRGGRGGEVKLKVELSALWVAVSEPYDVTLAARVWARLIGLADPDGRGASRVNSAVRQLVKSGLLVQHARPGAPSTLELLEETGAGADYTPPGARMALASNRGEDASAHRYFKVPTELWTNGWIAVLNGPALAMLLVLLQLSSGRSTEGLWFSPDAAERRFALSEETRRRGLTQLDDLGLVTTVRRPITSTPLEVPRFRNTHTLNLEHLRKATPMSSRIQVTHLTDEIDPQPYLVDETDRENLERLIAEVDTVTDPRLRTASVKAVAERTGLRMPLKARDLRAVVPLRLTPRPE